jgi:hypothetical protein
MTAESLQAEADAALASFAFASAADLYHRVLAVRETESARAGLERSRKMLRKELNILHLAQSKAQAVLRATGDDDDGRPSSLLKRGSSSPHRSFSASPCRLVTATAPPPSPTARTDLAGAASSASPRTPKGREWELEMARAETARVKEELAQVQADAAAARTEAATAQLASSAESTVAAVRTQSSREEVNNAAAAVRDAAADAAIARAEAVRVQAAAARAATTARIQQEAQHKECARLRAELKQVTLEAETSAAELTRILSSSASLKDHVAQASEQESRLKRDLEGATTTVAEQANQIESLSAEVDANAAMLSELRQKLDAAHIANQSHAVQREGSMQSEQQRLQESLACQQALRSAADEERDALKAQVLELEKWKAQRLEEAEVLSTEPGKSPPSTPARDVVAMQLAEEREINTGAPVTLELISVVFTEPGSLGLRLKPQPDTDNVRVDALVDGSQAMRHPKLKPGLVIHSIGGEQILGNGYSKGLEAVKAASRPVTIKFVQEQYIAVPTTDVSVTFTEPGSLGLKFTTSAASSTSVQLAQINRGTQAESHLHLAAALREHKGELYLRRIGADDMTGKTYKDVLTVLRASERPLALTFGPKQSSEGDAVATSVDTTSRDFVELDAERAREAAKRRGVERERDAVMKTLADTEAARDIIEKERDALAAHKAELTEELGVIKEICAREKALRVAAEEERRVWAKRCDDAIASCTREERRRIAIEEERLTLQLQLRQLREGAIATPRPTQADDGSNEQMSTPLPHPHPHPHPEPEPEPEPSLASGSVSSRDKFEIEHMGQHGKMASNLQQHEEDVAEFLREHSATSAGGNSSAQRVIQALSTTLDDSAGWVAELAAMKNDGTLVEFLKACSPVDETDVAAAEELVYQKEVKFDCRFKGKKRQLRVTQMNLGLFDGQRPVNSWLYEKIDGWEFSVDTTVLTLNVHKSNAQGNSGLESIDLKMASDEDGRAALSAIQSMVMGLVQAKKARLRQQKQQREQATSATGSGQSTSDHAADETTKVSSSAATSASSASGAGRVTATSMLPQGIGLFDAMLGSKSLQLQAGGMGLVVFAGGQPIETLLYTTLAGWEVTKKGLLVTKVDDTVSQPHALSAFAENAI